MSATDTGAIVAIGAIGAIGADVAIVAIGVGLVAQPVTKVAAKAVRSRRRYFILELR